MKIGNQIANAGLSNHYLDQARANGQKALNNISATRAISGADSANLIIADSLRSRSSSLEQGIANANDAVAILQIADSTLANITKSADRINELSVSLNSAALNSDQRKMISSEANALVNSMKDSLSQANFNGKNVFGDSMSFLTGNGVQSLNLSSANFANIDVNDQNSVHEFISGINSLRGEIGSAQSAIISGINVSLAQNVALKSSQNNLLNDDIAKNVNELNLSNLKLNASIMAQVHNNANLQNQVARLLG
ncbi:flagellin [Campylobacter sp.]|uniref:flagellin n=1 Tax=Campylobacter sp. TaxID=205 RepID=UPI0026F5B247|nr:flagellin [Campylobacter sp.]